LYKLYSGTSFGAMYSKWQRWWCSGACVILYLVLYFESAKTWLHPYIFDVAPKYNKASNITTFAPKYLNASNMTTFAPRYLNSSNMTSFSPVDLPKDSSLPRILLYITTHFSTSQMDFLRVCWPFAISKSILLQTADIAVFSTGATNYTLLRETFPPPRNLTVTEYNNPGYQEGAVLALQVAGRDNLFDGYDWVIRLNPDVIIRNDTWILATMRDPDVDGIFINCFKGKKNWIRLHTDFSAFRPAHLPKGTFINTTFRVAEKQFTRDMETVLQSERFRWLKDGRPDEYKRCRVDYKDSPVIHDHDYIHNCTGSYL
jgi:hypothetical protein